MNFMAYGSPVPKWQYKSLEEPTLNHSRGRKLYNGDHVNTGADRVKLSRKRFESHRFYRRSGDPGRGGGGWYHCHEL